MFRPQGRQRADHQLARNPTTTIARAIALRYAQDIRMAYGIRKWCASDILEIA